MDSPAYLHATPAVPARPGFQDSTALLSSVCADLREGQMVAVPKFSLMDSMAAVKIMDARMDSGMELPASELPESDRLNATFQLSDTHVFDPFKPLDVPDVLWIIDRLLACEAAWHQGSALSQTLYTCLYFHAIQSLSPKHPRFQEPNASPVASSGMPPQASISASPMRYAQAKPLQLVYKVLKAFILAMVKTIDVAWSELTSKQHLQDGEDFSSNKNGLSLLETTDTGYIIDELDDALQWVQSQQAILLPGQIESLKVRLSFRKQMLYVVRLLQSPAEAPPLDVVMHTKFARRNWALLHPASASDAEEPSRTTVSHGGATISGELAGDPNLMPLQPPDRNAAPSLASAAAFDPAYSRRLAWCQALRPISLPNATETWRILDGILEELQDVVRVLQLPGFLNWKAYFTHRTIYYQRMQPLLATPYTRSLLQTAVCDCNMIAGRLPLEWIAETFFQEVALINPLLLRRASRIGRNDIEGGSRVRWDAQPPLGQRVYYFTQRVAGQLVQYLTTLSQNRARCKRTLGSRLYCDWIRTSEEAADIGRQLETCLEPGERYLPDSLFAATQHLALEVMTQITLAGFELDLYSEGTDRESMWWLASRIQVEQKIVSTDLRDELSKWLEQIPREQRPRRHSLTILYLSRQALLAHALEQLAISTILLAHLSDRYGQRENPQSSVQRCPWPLSRGDDASYAELAGAVFASRIKWMRTDVRAGNRLSGGTNRDDPGETLWQEYRAFQGELKATDDSTLTMNARERMHEAIQHLQQLTASLAGDQNQELGAAGFSDTVASLLTTARHNLEILEASANSPSRMAITAFATSSAGSRFKKQTEWIFEHPWIPKWCPGQHVA